MIETARRSSDSVNQVEREDLEDLEPLERVDERRRRGAGRSGRGSRPSRSRSRTRSGTRTSAAGWTVIPTTASSDRTMIWATAKLTEVSRRQMARPSRAGGSSSGARARARVAAGLAIGLLLARGRRRVGRCRRGGGGRRGGHRAGARAASRPISKSATRSSRSSSPTETRSSPAVMPALGEGRVVELAVGRRRRMDDHREDAAERRGQLRQRQRVDDGPAGLAAALELEGEHPAAGRGAGGRRRRAGGGSAATGW